MPHITRNERAERKEKYRAKQEAVRRFDFVKKGNDVAEDQRHRSHFNQHKQKSARLLAAEELSEFDKTRQQHGMENRVSACQPIITHSLKDLPAGVNIVSERILYYQMSQPKQSQDYGGIANDMLLECSKRGKSPPFCNKIGSQQCKKRTEYTIPDHRIKANLAECHQVELNRFAKNRIVSVDIA